MDSAITVNSIVNLLAVIITVGGGITVLVKGLRAINEVHDRMQVWDGNSAEIEAVNKRVDIGRQKAQDSLDAIRGEMNAKLDENQTDTEAKLQEIRSEQEMLTYCMFAVLDGLHQLNCNGKVTEATVKLNEYLNEKAHN